MVDDEVLAGWYPDPSGDLALIRYWDGTAWTSHTYTLLNHAPPQMARQVQPQDWGLGQSVAQPQIPGYNQPQTSAQPQIPGYNQPQAYAQSQIPFQSQLPMQTQFQPQFQPQAQPQFSAQPQFQAQPQPTAPAGFIYTDSMTGQKTSSHNSLAVAAAICGIVGILASIFILGILPGICGLIFGIVSRNSKRKGMVTTGIVCGSVAILLSLLMFFYVLSDIY